MTMSTERTDEQLPVEELRTLFLFDALTPEQLDYLHERGWVNTCPAGDTIVDEGAPAELVFVLLSGTLAMSRRVGPDDVETTRTDHRGVYAGAMQSYLDAPDQRYVATAHAVTECQLFVMLAPDFAGAVREWFPMAMHLLEGLFYGLRNQQQIVAQRQQLLSLGQLAAGLTHELNNPAAAAVRANAALKERVSGMRKKLAMLAHHRLDPQLLQALVDVQDEAVELVGKGAELSPLEESEREDVVSDWLDAHGVADGWQLAPIFVNGGTPVELLDRVAERARPEVLDSGVRWVAYAVETELLLNEITDSVTRISTLVEAAKQYSHMDRAPFSREDIHAGLKSTLAMLSTKLQEVEVVKDFDRTLPPVPIYSGELNQVWTNLIDNAVQAMDGHGTLTLRSWLDGDMVKVSIGDTGPGIPPENQKRIFEPFFTTKPVGQGTGLGLDISYRIVVARHGGRLEVESQPGDTRFIVSLPLTERPAA